MTWQATIEAFAPLTVVTAIVLFTAKEVIEAVRRQKGKTRKASAIRILLIEEMELNNWTIKSLKSILGSIESLVEADPKADFFLKTDLSGAVHYRYRRSDGAVGGSWIPPVHRKYFDAFLPELAEIDKKLFEEARKGYQKIGDLEHVRNSLVAYLAEEDSSEKKLLRAFPSYGIGVVNEVENRMSAFYVFCSGRPFDSFRLR